MSRNELIAQIRSQVSSFPNTKIEQGIWTNEEFNNAMIAAYNRAIEDALELYYNPTSEEDQDTFDRDLESLKI